MPNFLSANTTKFIALSLSVLLLSGLVFAGAFGEVFSPAQEGERLRGDRRGGGPAQAARLPVSLVAGGEAGQASDAPLEEKTVRIKAVTGLQYDTVQFTARPGQRVRIAFSNESNMMHNMVFTTPGERVEVVKAALEMGGDGPAEDYVPDLESVWAYAPVLKPGDFYELTFTAPTEEGAYPFVCTYPGHGYVMYGVMRVTNNPGDVPPLSEDPLVPPDSLRGAVENLEATTLHPYSTEPPVMYRTFMPESGPASIAVGLRGGISYNFDAGRSVLRYAWSGGFVDNSDIWRGHKRDQRAEIIGTVFFRREGGAFPFRFGASSEGASENASENEPPAPSFKGYRLVEGRPEFEYEADGATVRHLIRPFEGEAPGLVQDFAISDAQGRPVRFVASRSDGVAYEASAGTWSGDTLRLAPAEARGFTITVLRQEPGQPARTVVGQRAPRPSGSTPNDSLSNASAQKRP